MKNTFILCAFLALSSFTVAQRLYGIDRHETA